MATMTIQELVAARKAAIADLHKQREAVFTQLDALVRDMRASYQSLSQHVEEIDGELAELGDAQGQLQPLPPLSVASGLNEDRENVSQ